LAALPGCNPVLPEIAPLLECTLCSVDGGGVADLNWPLHQEIIPLSQSFPHFLTLLVCMGWDLLALTVISARVLPYYFKMCPTSRIYTVVCMGVELLTLIGRSARVNSLFQQLSHFWGFTLCGVHWGGMLTFNGMSADNKKAPCGKCGSHAGPGCK
jgi:hypothetical protein